MKIIESSDGKHLANDVTFIPHVTTTITFPNGYVMDVEICLQLSARIYRVSNKNYTILLEESN